MADIDEVVAAYWQHYQLAFGARAERMSSAEFFWAWEHVQQLVDDHDPTLVEMLDSLLQAPHADPAYVGAGPIEDALHVGDAELFAAITRRCRLSDSWREAVGCVWIAADHPVRGSELSTHLPPAAGRQR